MFENPNQRRDQLEANRGRSMEASDQAIGGLNNSLEQKKIDSLPREEKQEVSRVIKELNNLRNDPAWLQQKLRNPETIALLERNSIPIDYINRLLADMRAIHHEDLLAQVDDVNMVPVKTELVGKVEWVRNSLHELFQDLGERAKDAIGPLSEDASLIAQLQSEVQAAEEQTNALLVNISKI